jgi:prophage DNA circulation protein
MQSPADIVTAWGVIATRIAADATSLFKLVALLSPSSSDKEFGRYHAGATLSPFPNSVPSVVLAPGTTIAALELQAAALRAAVAAALAAAGGAAAALAASTAAAFAASIAAVVSAAVAAMTDPADAVRLLPLLADFTPAPLPSSSAYSAGQAAIVTAIGNVCRREAVRALAQASALYQPSSQDDAATSRDRICSLIQVEILVAGDGGSDATFAALKRLRTAVATDLNARGADLAAVKLVNFKRPLPSFLAASRLYRDSTRAPELVAEADPVHPAFMPPSFRALAA